MAPFSEMIHFWSNWCSLSTKPFKTGHTQQCDLKGKVSWLKTNDNVLKRETIKHKTAPPISVQKSQNVFTLEKACSLFVISFPLWFNVFVAVANQIRATGAITSTYAYFAREFEIKWYCQSNNGYNMQT